MRGKAPGPTSQRMTSLATISKSALLIAAWAVPRVVADDSFSSGGCYRQSTINSLLLFSDSFQFQSTSHCEEQCLGKKVAALLNGGNCYCGDTVPDSDGEVDSDNCDSKCFGYGEQTCGGSGYFQIYVNAAVDGKTASSSSTLSSRTSTSSSSTSTSSSSSSTSSSSSSTSSSSSSSASSSSAPSTTSSASAITVVSTVTSENSGKSDSVITKTVDPSATSDGSSSGSHTTSHATSSSHSSSSSSSSSATPAPARSRAISTGGIVGAAIGSVAGVALIAALIFFLIYRRRKQKDDEDDEFDDKFTLSGPSAPNPMDPNPFLLASGYNNFDTQPQHDPSRTPSGPNAGNQLPYPTSYYHQTQNSDSSNSYGHHSRTNSQGFSFPVNNGQQPINTANGTEHSYHSSGDKEFIFDQPANNANGGDRPPSPEFGRRKLSNGSLPDMIARQPGSLKVVNN